MRITRNRSREDELLLRSEGEAFIGVHLTSVIGCLRRAYYDQVEGLKATRMMQVYRLIGIGIQAQLYQDMNNEEILDIPVDGGVVLITPDNVVECADAKSCRLNPQGEFPEDWIKQFAVYAWKAEQLWWNVDIVYLQRTWPKKGRVPEWVPQNQEAAAPALISYRVDFEPEEQERIVAEVRSRAETLFTCLEEKTVPPKEESWRCKSCQYQFLCELGEGT